MNFVENYLKSVRFEFERYKILGDKTFAQLSDDEIHWRYSENDNSIAIIVKHIVGNMLSRWTNFFIEDGEKPWRDRESEFTHPYTTKAEMIASWEQGWECLFGALESINSENFNSKVHIRNEAHTLPEAVNRQLAHYPNHVGQILYIGRMIKGKRWISPSIAKGDSQAFNDIMFKTKHS
ncbi:MAG: DUF1572 family protein [Bacteroidota bacterium]